MGQGCSNTCSQLCAKFSRNKVIPLVTVEEKDEPEVDIKFKKYQSSLDYLFKTIEENYMLLRYFQMFDVLMLITHSKASHPLTTDISTEDAKVIIKPYLEELDKADFVSIIENKIIKNNLVISILNDDEDVAKIFKEYMLELYDSLLMARIDNHKRKFPGVKVKKGSIKTIKKLYVYPIPFLFTSSTNKSKIEFIFNLLCNSNRLLVKNQEFNDFIFFLFMVAATCNLRAIKNTSSKFPTKLSSISSEEYVEKTDAFEVNDIIRLRDLFVEGFFKDKDILGKKDYDQKFLNDEFSWIFSPNGIRANLELHNDVKSQEEKQSAEIEK